MFDVLHDFLRHSFDRLSPKVTAMPELWEFSDIVDMAGNNLSPDLSRDREFRSRVLLRSRLSPLSVVPTLRGGLGAMDLS